MSELGDDGVIQKLGQLEPEVIEQLRLFAGDPDPGKDQIRDLQETD